MKTFLVCLVLNKPANIQNLVSFYVQEIRAYTRWVEYPPRTFLFCLCKSKSRRLLDRKLVFVSTTYPAPVFFLPSFMKKNKPIFFIGQEVVVNGQKMLRYSADDVALLFTTDTDVVCLN